MANLDVSLEDRIKMNQSPSSRSGSGPNRRFPNRPAARPAPYPIMNTVRAPVNPWDHGLLSAPMMPVQVGAASAVVGGFETGTKLLVSNLDSGVTDDDLRELFSARGDLKRCSVNYDRGGRSEGTAEVVFARRRDAEAAIKSYNNVQLDGKPMKIEIIGANIVPPPILPPVTFDGYQNNSGYQNNGGYQNNSGNFIRFGRGQARGGPRGGRLQGSVRGTRNGRGGGRSRDEKISAEDLDADLEKYLAKAKEQLPK